MRFEAIGPKSPRTSGTPVTPDSSQQFIDGVVQSGAGPLPRVKARLEGRDRLGALAVRLGIHRDDYRVDPGLYAVGSPGADSAVLVSANYKLSFDVLRKELGSLDAWILVLDTKGVNVWCSAGKGSFGNAELATRIRLTRLGLVVGHRTLVLPQLSATGVSAPSFKREEGWTIQFGPVHARDIPAYLASARNKTETMRVMQFPLVERIKLIPLEFVQAIPRMALLLLLWLLAAFAGILTHGLPTTDGAWTGLALAAMLSAGKAWLAAFAALTVGTVLVPAFLPWIPCRAFTLKGLLAGAALCLVWIATAKTGILESIALALALPAISAWMALNFTGCSTYTSLAGVKVEVTAARIPLIVAISAGLGLRTILLFAGV